MRRFVHRSQAIGDATYRSDANRASGRGIRTNDSGRTRRLSEGFVSTRAGRVPAAQSTGKKERRRIQLFPGGNRAQFYGAPFWQARTSDRSGPALEHRHAGALSLVPRRPAGPAGEIAVRLQTLYSRQLLATETSEVPAIKRRAKRWGGRPSAPGGTAAVPMGSRRWARKSRWGSIAVSTRRVRGWKSWSRVIRGTRPSQLAR